MHGKIISANSLKEDHVRKILADRSLLLVALDTWWNVKISK
jgi:hypothetical protein